MKSILILIVAFPRHFYGFFSRNDSAPEVPFDRSLFFAKPKAIIPPPVNFTGKPVLVKSRPKSTCGIDNSPVSHVYEGTGQIETYPWLGVLYYPKGVRRLVTTVVLVAKAIVIGSAVDIHKMPKRNFRSRARVVLGQNCTHPGLKIRDYTFHPHYGTNTSSTLVIIQLDLRNLTLNSGYVLRPICAPPLEIKEQNFYAMVLHDSCKNSKIKIYEMDYVSKEHCNEFYRREGLDVKSIWPTYTACGRARTGGDCIWRDGAVLAVKQQGAWHLLGFGVHGPGCAAPSRFIDYNMHVNWVRRSIARTGEPAITQISESEIIMRLINGNIQRFGQCDVEEIITELYTDTTIFEMSTSEKLDGIARYNMTVFSHVDYSCIYFWAAYPEKIKIRQKPRIRLSYYCPSSKPFCWQPGSEKIDFFVQIEFEDQCIFKMAAYGQQRRALAFKSVIKYFNMKKINIPKPPWT